MSKGPNKFLVWLTAYAPRWNKLAWGGALLLIFLSIVEHLKPETIPAEAFWLSLGVIIGAFANAMTAPDPSKSEVLTLAERIIDRDNENAG